MSKNFNTGVQQALDLVKSSKAFETLIASSEESVRLQISSVVRSEIEQIRNNIQALIDG